jgi:hypothetical protein
MHLNENYKFDYLNKIKDWANERLTLAREEIKKEYDQAITKE